MSIFSREGFFLGDYSARNAEIVMLPNAVDMTKLLHPSHVTKILDVDH